MNFRFKISVSVSWRAPGQEDRQVSGWQEQSIFYLSPQTDTRKQTETHKHTNTHYMKLLKSNPYRTRNKSQIIDILDIYKTYSILSSYNRPLPLRLPNLLLPILRPVTPAALPLQGLSNLNAKVKWIDQETWGGNF